MTNNNMIFIANWKMYGNTSNITKSTSVIKLANTKNYKKHKIIYCPPYTLLKNFYDKVKNTNVYIGAQNCHSSYNFGAYTGSINAKLIKSTGAKYIIIGHSENRSNGETDLIINKKIRSALNENLKVIFCIGEKLSDKKNKKTYNVLKKQINNGLKSIKKLDSIIFAYEPVWSIGTGIIPKISDLQKDINFISSLIKKKYSLKKPIILYGGSVNDKNIMILKEIKDISGFLVGGASIDPKKFIDIVKKTFN